MADADFLSEVQSLIDKVSDAETDDFSELLALIGINSKQELSGQDLSGLNLRCVDLSNANLADTNLSNTDLRNANLSEANLSNADLSNADLSNADLSNANLMNAFLSGTKYSEANLSGAVIANCYGISYEEIVVLKQQGAIGVTEDNFVEILPKVLEKGDLSTDRLGERILILNYTDFGLFIQYVTTSLEEVLTRRLALAVNTSKNFYLEPGQASFLLPKSGSLLLSQFLELLEAIVDSNVTTNEVDEEFLEVSVKGIWAEYSPESESGVFFAVIPDEISLPLYRLWQETQRQTALFGKG